MDQRLQGPPVPPPELVEQWAFMDRAAGATRELWVATQAARWGADQELEACCEWLGREVGSGWGLGAQLCDARRPKPPSLKEQALIQLSNLVDDLRRHGLGYCDDTIRRALKSLPDDQ